MSYADLWLSSFWQYSTNRCRHYNYHTTLGHTWSRAYIHIHWSLSTWDVLLGKANLRRCLVTCARSPRSLTAGDILTKHGTQALASSPSCLLDIIHLRPIAWRLTPQTTFRPRVIYTKWYNSLEYLCQRVKNTTPHATCTQKRKKLQVSNLVEQYKKNKRQLCTCRRREMSLLAVPSLGDGLTHSSKG